MTNTQKFIEDAIKGGWREHSYFSHFNDDEVAFGDIRKEAENNPCLYIDIHAILLDPSVWQAVGKTREWKYEDSKDSWGRSNSEMAENMHRFLDHLIEGKSIEEALSEIK